MIVRSEIPDDRDSIRKIHIDAFADHPYSERTEHLIVEALRVSCALTVSLVVVVNGIVAGHVAFSPVKINGLECMWFGVGPIGVSPRLQGRGIGRELMLEGLKAVRGLGAEGCVLVGDLGFYRRFGFRHNPDLVLKGVPAEYFLCLPMTDKTPKGYVTFHPAFMVRA